MRMTAAVSARHDGCDVRVKHSQLFIRKLGIEDAGQDHLGDLLGGLTDERPRML